MIRNRVIHFEAELPSVEHLQMAMEDYLGACRTATIRDANPGFTVLLMDVRSNPMRRIPFHISWTLGSREAPEEKESRRRIDVLVWHSTKCVHVTTHWQDEFTNAVADGYARMVARIWQGRLEMG